MGFPIRTSADQFVFANPRSLSQLITSFFASKSQGIPRTPFLNFLSPLSKDFSLPYALLLSFLFCLFPSMSKNFALSFKDLQIFKESNLTFFQPTRQTIFFNYEF